VNDFRGELLARFEWIGGHANVLALFSDGAFLAATARALADPFSEFTKVAAVEARGFVLGTAVALHAGVGFVPIRKAGAIHPGPKARRLTEPDWRGTQHELVLQRAAISGDDRVLLVDDWAEVGSQATAARALIEDCGAAYAGLSLLVDQLTDEVRDRLQPVAAIVSHAELPSSA
jgi:adenine/guanine phosphoribosyltransferase-like PRPP-binding protein